MPHFLLSLSLRVGLHMLCLLTFVSLREEPHTIHFLSFSCPLGYAMRLHFLQQMTTEMAIDTCMNTVVQALPDS